MGSPFPIVHRHRLIFSPFLDGRTLFLILYRNACIFKINFPLFPVIFPVLRLFSVIIVILFF